MTWNRRELLAGLGVGSASLLFAFGCGAPAQQVQRQVAVRSDVRAWLRDAVSRLSTVFPQVHALAVTRRRTTAAIDILGTGVARTRRDGVVLTVRDKDGVRRELVTAELSEPGVQAAVRALAQGKPKPGSVMFPLPPAPAPEPAELAELGLRNRVGALQRLDRSDSSRIVYAAATIDVDDTTVWSIAPGLDLEQQRRRVRKSVVRASWNGTRPSVSTVERGWVGEVDDQQLGEDEVTAASENAMLLVTPGSFTGGAAHVVLEPSVSATIIDAAVRGLMTSAAARRPEVARRLALGAAVAAPSLTLVDDPRAPGAYGGIAFDDEGATADAVTLLDSGRVAGRLAAGRMRRAGHVGLLAPAPSHLRLSPGTGARRSLYGDGWLLEGKVSAAFDPASDRIVVACARARALAGGNLTGEVYADVELVGDLAALLAAVEGVAEERATTVLRDEIDGEPLWCSIEAPWLRTRGVVRARRSRS
ncbi:MAG: hypothetical protein JNL83_15650 [Myxococcales bacterium]|nr:hypothetical protein [Myxococcales bacterium]